MNSTFYEQLGGVAGVFEQWGACERTVVACALARRVPWPGLKLVQRAVEAALMTHGEDELLERDANDDTLLASLLAWSDDDDDDDDRLRRLITLLPMLRADNERAKAVYVSAAPALVQRCVDAPPARRAPDLCRQLLSYLLVHPALTQHDQRILTQWLRCLENHISGNRPAETIWQQRIDPCLLPETNIWGPNGTFRRTIGKNIEFRSLIDPVDCNTFNTDLLQESFSKNGRDVDISIDVEKQGFDATISQPKPRSNSLTPPSTNFVQMSSSSENLSDEPFVQKPRSFSLSSEHSLGQMKPISVMYGTTGSETRLDDLRSHNFTEHPGMSMVAQWLKSLRLHKYVWLFTNITYEQMMAMDEEYLEKLGVTKGARHKLLLSIKKLNERAALVESARAELAAEPTPAVATRALDKIRGVLLTPMPAGSDLPPAIVTVLELASKCISECRNGSGARVPAAHGDADDPAVDPLSLHCWLVDKALHHESFSTGATAAALRRLRHRLPPRQFFRHVGDMPPHARQNKHRWRTGPHNGYQKPLYKRPWLPHYKTGPPQPRGKSNSYPPFPPTALIRPQPPASTYGDEYSSLDALCLQMTEQAIN